MSQLPEKFSVTKQVYNNFQFFLILPIILNLSFRMPLPINVMLGGTEEIMYKLNNETAL